MEHINVKKIIRDLGGQTEIAILHASIAMQHGWKKLKLNTIHSWVRRDYIQWARLPELFKIAKIRGVKLDIESYIEEKTVKLQDTTIRASALSGYNDCARRASARMFPLALAEAGFTFLQNFRTIGAAIGHGAHAALQYTLQSKIDGLGQGHDDVAEGTALAALEADTADGVRYDDSVALNLQQAQGQVIRTTRMIRAAVTPRIDPVEVEIEMKATYRGMEIIGHMDVREPTSMGDLKTGKFERQNAPQYGAYAMLGETIGHEVSSFKEYYLKTVPIDKMAPPPKIQQYDVISAKEQAKQMLDYIIDDYEAFLLDGNHKHFRANPASLLCSPKYCPAFGTPYCREHKGA